MNAFRWLSDRLIARVSRRAPDFVIGRSDSGEYLRRWWILRNRFFNIYLHNILRSDKDKEFHCHPWWNCSVILRGSYVERMPMLQSQNSRADDHFTRDELRDAGSVVLRGGTWRHRIIGPRDCWTLFITGPRYRVWGFHCRKGFVPWTDFVDPADKGQVGRGCGEMA